MKADQIPRTIEERTGETGYRRIMLNEPEREALVEQELVERAVALYLDLGEAWSQRQIAEELGLTVKQLKRLNQSELFKEVYESHFSELGHDPRLKATRAGLVDLLPLAFARLHQILEREDTPATVLMKAVERVLELNGIQPQEARVSDRKELAEFLGKANLTQINITVPEGYKEAVSDVIEGSVSGEGSTPED